MIRERFEEKFQPVTESGCWLWTAGSSKAGYGNFRVGKERDILAHRWAWRLFRGEIPEGKHVLHKCDVRCCVNPAHLFIGTNEDNIIDRVRKGRSSKTNKRPRGLKYRPMSSQGRANKRIHNDEKQLQARQFFAEGNMSQRQIANTLGVSQTWVSNISRGILSW